MDIKVTDTLDDLIGDLQTITRWSVSDLRSTVREGAKTGNVIARDFARVSAGRHGKHYPRSFSSEERTPFLGAVASVFAAEYGPDASRPQGGMSFERGSRNQPAHRDLARSADVIGPALQREVRDLLDKWFWPVS